MLKSGENNTILPNPQLKRKNLSKIGIKDYNQPLIAAISAAGSTALKTALPATKISAPASRSAAEFFSDTPPSTSIRHSSPLLAISDLSVLILEYDSSRNYWPPQPAKTDMTRKNSHFSR